MKKSADQFDVIIIGGSFAGLSGALALARANRRILIIDNDSACNKAGKFSHNFLTRDGEKINFLAKKAKAQVVAYPTVTFMKGEVLDAYKTERGIMAVRTENNKVFFAFKLLFATGIRDIMPGIAGFAECWGKTILHCPYCHGYEVKDEKMAVVANGEHAYHLCVLLTNLTRHITLFTNGPSVLTEEQRRNISSKNIEIVETVISDIEQAGGEIRQINFVDGSKFKCSVMFAKVLLRQQCEIPERLGCEFKDHLIKVDFCQKTTVEHVYAAGDNCRLPRTVSLSVAAGTEAAFMLNWELTTEQISV